MSVDWLQELMIKRKAQRSNTFILETFDVKRVREMMAMIEEDKFKVSEEKKNGTMKISYEIQRNRLVDLANKQPITGDITTSPYEVIDGHLTTTRTIVLIHYVVSQNHADALSDYLIAWSQNAEMYHLKSTVLVFTSDLGLFNPVLQRLAYTITIVPSTADERRRRLETLRDNFKKQYMEKYNKDIDLDVKEEYIQASAGLDGGQVEAAAVECFVFYKSFEPVEKITNSGLVTAFTEQKKKILQADGLEYTNPSIDFGCVGGYKLLKTYLINRVIKPLRDPEKANYYGIGMPRGLIFYGYAGTGKSFMVEAVAKEMGLPMIKLDPSSLFRSYVGESEARVRRLTTLIETLSPIIVFVDEVDSLAPARGSVMSTDSGVSMRILNSLLEWLGRRDRKSIVIGATNRFEALDQAFTRVGRFDATYLFLLPDAEAREEILQVHSQKIRKLPLDKDVDLKTIAKETRLMTGAELEKVCIDAGRYAFEQDAKKVTMEHFGNAYKHMGINMNERQKRINEMLDVARKIENMDKNFLAEVMKEYNEEGSNVDGRISGLDIDPGSVRTI